MQLYILRIAFTELHTLHSPQCTNHELQVSDNKPVISIADLYKSYGQLDVLKRVTLSAAKSCQLLDHQALENPLYCTAQTFWKIHKKETFFSRAKPSHGRVKVQRRMSYWTIPKSNFNWKMPIKGQTVKIAI